MMNINNELEFKPYFAEAVWRVVMEKASEHLSQYE